MYLRVILFVILIYLIVRLVRKFMSGPPPDDNKKKSGSQSRSVSKDIGEYIDYEEVSDKKKKKDFR